MAEMFNLFGCELYTGRGVYEGQHLGSDVRRFWTGGHYPTAADLAKAQEWAEVDTGVRFIEAEAGVANVTQAVDVERELYVVRSRVRFGLFPKVVSITEIPVQ